MCRTIAGGVDDGSDGGERGGVEPRDDPRRGRLGVEVGRLAGGEPGAERLDLGAGGVGDEFVGVALARRDEWREFEQPGDGRQLAKRVLAHDETSLPAIAPRVQHPHDFIGPVTVLDHGLLERGIALADPRPSATARPRWRRSATESRRRTER